MSNRLEDGSFTPPLFIGQQHTPHRHVGSEAEEDDGVMFEENTSYLHHIACCDTATNFLIKI